MKRLFSNLVGARSYLVCVYSFGNVYVHKIAGFMSLAGSTTVKVKVTGLTPGPHGFHVVSSWFR